MAEDTPPLPDGRPPAPLREPAPLPAPAQKTRIKVGDKEVEVDEDLGAVLEAERSHRVQLETELGHARQQLDATAARWQRLEGAISPGQPTETDLDLEFFRSPKTAIQRMKEELRQELRGEYTRVEAQKSFWGGFYSEHRDLAEFRDMVEQMAGSQTYANINVHDGEAMGKFADAVRQRLLGIAGKFGGGRRGAGPRRTVESGGVTRGTSRESVHEEDEPPQVLSLSERLRVQAERRGTTRRSTG